LIGFTDQSLTGRSSAVEDAGYSMFKAKLSVELKLNF